MLQFFDWLNFIFDVVKFTEKKLVAMALGQRVKELRKSKNLSQEELGHLLQITVGQIGRIERGTINTGFHMIYKLAEGLGVTPWYLVMADFSEAAALKKADS